MLTSAGRTREPFFTTTSPFLKSSPVFLMFSPGFTSERTLTKPSPEEVFSTITTAVAPSGTGAPVIMRTAWPFSTGPLGTCPAGRS